MEIAAGVESPESQPRYQQRGNYCVTICHGRVNARGIRRSPSRRRKSSGDDSLQVDKGANIDRLRGGNRIATAHGTKTGTIVGQGHYRESTVAGQQRCRARNRLGIEIYRSQVQRAGRQGGKESYRSPRVSRFSEWFTLLAPINRAITEKKVGGGQVLVQGKVRGKTTYAVRTIQSQPRHPEHRRDGLTGKDP